MGRKGKVQKHTAKEIANKHKQAKERAGAAGHGKDGQKGREASMMKVKVQCKICLTAQPHLAAMRNHYENKHPKEPWSDDLYDFGAARSQAKPPVAKGEKKSTLVAKKPAKKGGKEDLSFLDDALK
ncbi:Zinc finger protein 706 [Hondaea fermentalgiana]|uniref:Zinc finger protein 706 n=1 Tax=Hondaea fermentalgiana TaxID=2315210 RepID=A0A2R5GMC4_9STRA|nr:Zinc finger protein 706 [Hondaea fermentalgiana]|eukprot:GBG29451.1 Zinc finger protein 706 [Hondaea fermentalgiana]